MVVNLTLDTNEVNQTLASDHEFHYGVETSTSRRKNNPYSNSNVYYRPVKSQEGYIEELTRFSQCLNAKTVFF